jgi:hypothetical protein
VFEHGVDAVFYASCAGEADFFFGEEDPDLLPHWVLP